MNPAHARLPRIAVTVGEPAGVGPELVTRLAERTWPAELVVLGDADLMARRATQSGIEIVPFAGNPEARTPARAGRLLVAHRPLAAASVPGRLDTRNAKSVLGLLDEACDGCLSGRFDAMLTAPVHKGVINDAGIPFSGHTEYLAARCSAPLPVMLLVAGTLRVALVTTHLPLSDVPAAITTERVEATARILDEGLRLAFGIARPRIVVLGLNPHAGESGHLGTEEIATITPALDRLRRAGIDVRGPIPADTAFVAHHLAGVDAVLAMYHDQGLPVLKHHGFGHAVNVTLGLPIIRTSVDHGTALDLSGTGRADAGSLQAALDLAIAMAGNVAR